MTNKSRALFSLWSRILVLHFEAVTQPPTHFTNCWFANIVSANFISSTRNLSSKSKLCPLFFFDPDFRFIAKSIEAPHKLIQFDNKNPVRSWVRYAVTAQKFAPNFIVLFVSFRFVSVFLLLWLSFSVFAGCFFFVLSLPLCFPFGFNVILYVRCFATLVPSLSAWLRSRDSFWSERSAGK